MIEFVCNDRMVTARCAGGLPVLDWIRDQHKLKGTKEGCREGDCGACTVVLGRFKAGRLEYCSVCSCLLPIAAVHRCHLATIEGLTTGDRLTPFQRAFYEEAASQCGFCTPGMIMSLTAFLLGNRALTLGNALESLDGNICRCTGYAAVRRAVKRVIGRMPKVFENRLDMLVEQGHVPEYFKGVAGLLEPIEERRVEEGGTIVAGGTDLYVNPDDQLLEGEPGLVSRISVPEGTSLKDGTVFIGAGTTVESIRSSGLFKELFPGTDGFFTRISSTQIRSMATLGGNIMNGSPIADLAVLFLVFGAVVHTRDRTVPLEDFYLGYRMFAVDKSAVITGISFPLPQEGAVLSALKVCRREYLDIASVNSAALVTLKNGHIQKASISAGGVAPFPLLLKRTSEFLQGRQPSDEIISRAGELAAAEISPISDVRGSKEYKTLLLKSLLRAHLTRGIMK